MFLVLKIINSKPHTTNCKLFYNDFLRCRAVLAGEYAGVDAGGQAFQRQGVLRLAAKARLAHHHARGVYHLQLLELRLTEIEGYAVLGRVGVGGDFYV